MQRRKNSEAHDYLRQNLSPIFSLHQTKTLELSLMMIVDRPLGSIKNNILNNYLLANNFG
jgi:hypothetical protein